MLLKKIVFITIKLKSQSRDSRRRFTRVLWNSKNKLAR